MPFPWITSRRRPWQGRTMLLGTLFLGLLAWSPGARANAVNAALFPMPEVLRPQVEFWKRVFAGLDTTGGILHDMEDLSIVYHIWYSDLPSSQSLRQATLDEARNQYRTILATLAEGKRTDFSSDEQRVWDMFRGKQYPDAFRAAMGTMRFQGGMRGRFAQGLIRSWSYLPEMEQIFASEGVPIELTRLPHVESSFENRALSKVGAAGVWQIMPATGRRFLRVDGEVDERLHVSTATRAAARLLRENYDKLGTWPLAITAYNHGANGMKQAVATVGTTDFGVIVQRYRGPLFGFASRNFYAEFLAALEVSTHYKQYFGDIQQGDTSQPLSMAALEGSAPRVSSFLLEPALPMTLTAYDGHAPLALATLAEGQVRPSAPVLSLEAANPPVVPASEQPNLLEDPVIDESTPPIISTALPVPPAPDELPALQEPAPAVAPRVASAPPRVVTPPVARMAPKPVPVAPRLVEVAPAEVAPPPVVAPAPRLTPVEPRPPVQPAPVVVPPTVTATPRRVTAEPRPQPPAPAVVAAAPAPAPPVARSDYKEYKVSPGETLTGLARRHGASVAVVAAANNLSPRTNVQAGQTLLLPALPQPVRPTTPPPAARPAPVVAQAEKPAAKTTIVPVESPFRSAQVLPVQRAAWSEVTPTPALEKPPLVPTAQRRPQDQRSQEEEFLRRNRVAEVSARKLKPGETLASVARATPGVPLWLMQRYNAHLDLNTPRPGAEVRIPKVGAKS